MCATCVIYSVSWCAARLLKSPGDAEAAFFNVGRPILDFAKPSIGLKYVLSILKHECVINKYTQYIYLHIKQYSS